MKKVWLVVSFIFISSAVQAGVDPTLQRAIDAAYNAQTSEAKAAINQYIGAHPDDPVGYIVKGTIGDWEDQVNNLRGANDTQILADYKRANDLAFHQWDKDQNNIDKMINLGNSYLYLARKWIDLDKKSRAGLILKKCKKHMEEAIEKDPSRYDAYLAIGSFNYFAANIPPGLKFLTGIMGISGNEQKGISQLNQTANNSNIYQADAQFLLTYIFGESKKDYTQTKKYLEPLIAKYPNNPQFRFSKIKYAYRGKAYAESEAAYQDFMSFCDSHKCNSYYQFQSNYYLLAGLIKQQKYVEARKYLETTQKMDPHHDKKVTANLSLYNGIVLKSEGKKEEARAALEAAKNLVGDKESSIYQTADKELANL
ncbi:hypothetical protein K1X76_06000 [bacterium]|nr:hypothetical protein [bacterium]